MSGVIVASVITAAAAAYSGYAQSEAADAQRESQNKALQQAKDQQKAADEANNRANSKSADSNAIMSAAAQAAKRGVGGTMLTGPQGVGNDLLSLGKSTLLGS